MFDNNESSKNQKKQSGLHSNQIQKFLISYFVSLIAFFGLLFRKNIPFFDSYAYLVNPSNSVYTPLADLFYGFWPLSNPVLGLFGLVLITVLISVFFLNKIGKIFSKKYYYFFSIIFFTLSPIAITEFSKLENDVLAFPILIASTYFFFKYLKQKNMKSLLCSFFLIGLACLFWSPSIFLIVFFLLIWPIKYGWFFALVLLNFFIFTPLKNVLIWNFGIVELTPFASGTMLMTIFPMLIAIILPQHPQLKKIGVVWVLLLGLLFPKLIIFTLILGIPYLFYVILNYKKTNPEFQKNLKKKLMYLCLFFCVLNFVVIMNESPTNQEIELIQKYQDWNGPISNSWTWGYPLIYYGYDTNSTGGSSHNIHTPTGLYFGTKIIDECELIQETKNMKLQKCP